MLQKIINNGLYSFKKEFTTWEDAVRESCKILKDKGIISSEYEDAIVNNIKEYGPYIVIVDGIAMPHSTTGGVGVYDNAISFMKVEKPVIFYDEKNNAEKRANLFFTLAALDSNKHLENMQELMDLLLNEDLVKDLFKVQNIEDLNNLANKYNNN